MPDARKVLVVDDHPDCRESMVMLLEAYGFDVISASGGAEALQIARTCHPSVILTDLNMPGMNGLELAKAIRADCELRNTFLISHSGSIEQWLPDRSASTPFNRHLTKPAAVADLVAAVGEAQAH